MASSGHRAPGTPAFATAVLQHFSVRYSGARGGPAFATAVPLAAARTVCSDRCSSASKARTVCSSAPAFATELPALQCSLEQCSSTSAFATVVSARVRLSLQQCLGRRHVPCALTAVQALTKRVPCALTAHPALATARTECSARSSMPLAAEH